MRVLMTADTVGGVWSFAMELSRALSARGVEIVLATMGARPSAPQRVEAQAIPTLSLHDSEYRLEWMDDPWDDVEAAGEWLLELEQRMRPDVIQLNGYAHGVLPWIAPVVVVGHSCVMSWWEAVRGSDAPPRWSHYREAVAHGLHAADLVVTPTRAMLEALSRHYGPPAHARVIANGRDPSRFQPAAKEPIVFTAGRLWDEGKNVGAVCDAAAAVTWPVYAAGDTRGPAGGERVIDSAHALGRLDERGVAEWMGRAAVYALPARYEPFGLSVLEAALARCALVLGDIPPLRENWDSAALFVAPDDRDELVLALDRLADDPALREALASEAHARGKKLSHTRMAAAYLSAFEEVGAGCQGMDGETTAGVACAS